MMPVFLSFSIRRKLWSTWHRNFLLLSFSWSRWASYELAIFDLTIGQHSLNRFLKEKERLTRPNLGHFLLSLLLVPKCMDELTEYCLSVSPVFICLFLRKEKTVAKDRPLRQYSLETISASCQSIGPQEEKKGKMGPIIDWKEAVRSISRTSRLALLFLLLKEKTKEKKVWTRCLFPFQKGKKGNN